MSNRPTKLSITTPNHLIWSVDREAFARRKFYDARTVQLEAAHRALIFIQQLYAIEREAGVLKSDLQQPTDRGRKAIGRKHRSCEDH
ncbi:hypothetical protein [uncultured Gimesia sp.]|uniref:hypothetical protein n=1 Tax=uncultured Gimesia sp. TaxID=1678688 RepID=UPI0030D79E79